MEDLRDIIKLYTEKIELLHSQIDSLEADSTTLELLVNAIVLESMLGDAHFLQDDNF